MTIWCRQNKKVLTKLEQNIWLLYKTKGKHSPRNTIYIFRTRQQRKYNHLVETLQFFIGTFYKLLSIQNVLSWLESIQKD